MSHFRTIRGKIKIVCTRQKFAAVFRTITELPVFYFVTHNVVAHSPIYSERLMFQNAQNTP